MPTKVERIIDSIKANAGTHCLDNITALCGTPEKSTPREQAMYVEKIMNGILELHDEALAEKVMKPCGHQCISNSVIDKAKKLYSASGSIDEFLSLLNEQHIGGGQLHTKDGKIIGVYNTCFCGLAKHAKNLSPVYCYCSAGWFERLFSSVLETPVKVTKMQSILDGSDKCLFEIVVSDIE